MNLRLTSSTNGKTNTITTSKITRAFTSPHRKRMETNQVNITDHSIHESGMSGYDSLLVGAVFFCSLVVGFSLTMFGFIVYYYCTLRNKKNRPHRTIEAAPTYIPLDPIKYSQVFAEDPFADGTKYYPYPMNKKIY